MRAFYIASLLVFAPPSCTSRPLDPPAPSAPRTTVLDYYLALPDAFFSCENSPAINDAFKQSQITTVEVETGYLLATIEGWPMQVALFVDRAHGADYVVVNLACGAGCMCNQFDVLAAPAMKSVRKAVFPSDRDLSEALRERGVDEPYRFDLPRSGTTIRVLEDGTNKEVLAVRWDGAGNFHLP